MASVKGIKLVLKVGNGASPEVFTARCSLNAQRGIKFTADLQDTAEVDCTDPEKVAWLVRDKVSVSGEVNASGVLDKADLAFFFDWVKDKDAKNCEVVVDIAGGYLWEGAWHCSDFEVTGDRGKRCEISINLKSEGEIEGSAVD
ncbi:hypothetical protein J2X45_001724 [Caulobacter sp. BE264]|uniref:phage tail tube protein n=1 Tax=Caulobacter sp. BE264 TaxID=2817724 RepID=UPI00285FE891|nr:phage tail tube protein [Caulobacter sp. BE264]MDR7230633.1 hypothetical protein [Caulobacter sp. BE264]